MEVSKIVKALARVARPLILKRWRPDSCIASTKIAVEVLREFDIPARPWVCTATVLNGPMAARMRAGQTPQRGNAQAWYQEDGAWSVGIGFGTKQIGKWPGHMVALAAGEWLIDLSLDQASRPEKGMPLAPVALPLSANLYAGLMAGEAAEWEGPRGCVLWYKSKEEDGWRQSGDWNDERRHKATIAHVVTLIRKAVK